MQMNHRRSIEKVEDDIRNRCAVKRGGICTDQVSGDGYLFTSLHDVRYKGGVIFTRGYDSEQGSAVCRCEREHASKDLTSLLSMRHAVADQTV